ncbi:MAG: peptidyl-prolyl cis-trans isomerase [Clostridia bacterium]|nr:peptidyl-prolyl cis-trans isomerase [Clostridia bacterium]
MAKANKSPYAKKAPTHMAAKRVIGKIISIILCVAIVGGICWAGLSFFGVPQKVAKAVEIDGKSYSMAELSAYYMLEYQNYRYQTASYDENYGEGYGKMFTGYDYNLSPAEQTTTNDQGEEVTWDEQFMHLAILEMAKNKRYLAAAEDANTEFTDEDKETIDKALSQYDDVLGSYSLSRYLSKSMGKGVTEGLFKKIVTEQTLVSRYQENIKDDLKAKYSDAEVESVYAEAVTDYDAVDFRWFTIDVAKADEEAGIEASDGTAELAEAQAFIDAIKAQKAYDEETFKAQALAYVTENDPDEVTTYKLDGATKLSKVAYATAQSNISDEGANWLFEQKGGKYVRQNGEMKAFLDSDGDTVYILYALGTPYRNDTVKASVRHILVQFDTPDEAAEQIEEDSTFSPEEEEILDAVNAEEASAEAATGTDTAVSETPAADEAEETTVAQEIKDAAKAEAESILAEYKEGIAANDGEPDEQLFAQLADNYSDDTATTSANSSGSGGGLIEDLGNDDSYVAEFEDWVFAEGNYANEKRKEGDTAVIETEYGYHVMYYVGGHEHPEWYESIQNTLISEDWDLWQKDFEGQFSNTNIIRTVYFCNKVKEGCLKIIDSYISRSTV